MADTISGFDRTRSGWIRNLIMGSWDPVPNEDEARPYGLIEEQAHLQAPRAQTPYAATRRATVVLVAHDLTGDLGDAGERQ